METHYRVIRLLADGEIHSGEALAERLGISRAAVWKAVHKAGTALGLEIRRIRGRGYCLDAPLELLDRDRILAEMDGDARRHIAGLCLFDDIDSTNSHLMREAEAGAPGGTLCLAERQSAGRGRQGRTWVSPYGANLYLSLLWRFPMGPAALGGLSLAAGAAVAGVLRDEGIPDIALKWPNDVLWQGRKLAGLLLEVAGEAKGPSLVVVGLGLNIRLGADAAAAIDQPWVDLAAIPGAAIPGAAGRGRNRLAARIAGRLVDTLSAYAAGGFGRFLAAWESFDLYRGAPVALRLGDKSWVGTHAGVTPRGELRLAVEGRVLTFSAGEVSLRPVQGPPDS